MKRTSFPGERWKDVPQVRVEIELVRNDSKSLVLEGISLGVEHLVFGGVVVEGTIVITISPSKSNACILWH